MNKYDLGKEAGRYSGKCKEGNIINVIRGMLSRTDWLVIMGVVVGAFILKNIMVRLMGPLFGRLVVIALLIFLIVWFKHSKKMAGSN